MISANTAKTDDDTEGDFIFDYIPFSINMCLDTTSQNIYVEQDDEFWDWKDHLHVGDKNDTNYMAYMGINIDGLPIANIVSATLFFYIYDDTGTPATNNPYTMDHVDFGSNFTMGEEYLQAIQSNIFTYIYTNEEVWVSVPVTDQVIYDLINRKSWTLNGSDQWFQVRMYADNILKNSDNSDYFSIRSTHNNSKTNEWPYLRIYYLPEQVLSHFTISHDTNAVVNEWNRIIITAKNDDGITIWSNIGTATISVAGDNGAISWSNGNNCGTFSNLGNEAAAYTFNGCEEGVVTLYIMEDIADTINIEVISAVSAKTDDDTEGPLYFYNRTFLELTKVKVPPAGDPWPGDYVRFRIDYTNQGETALNVRITDIIPLGTEYLQGSMSNTTTGTLTDAPGDDEGYCDGNQIIVCVDNGTAPSAGGTLGPNEAGSLFFTVLVLTNSQPSINYVKLGYQTKGFDAELYSDGGGDQNNDNTKLGDFGYPWDDVEIRAITSFDLPSELTSGNIGITSATLKIIRKDNFYGNDADKAFIDPIHIDLVHLGNSPGPEDYDSLVFQSDIATLNMASKKDHSIPMTAALNETLFYYRTKFQIRYRPDAITTDSSNDNWRIYSFDDDSYKSPELHIRYGTNILNESFTNKAEITGNNFDTTSATLGVQVNLLPDAEVSISKIIDNISMTNSAGNPMPGAVITYRLKYTNSPTAQARVVKISDPLASGLTFYPGSLKHGDLFGDYASASNLTDISLDDEGSYNSGEVVFCISNGVAPSLPGNLSPGKGGYCYYRASVGSSLQAGTLISNAGYISGRNFSSTNSGFVSVTVATQYGGRLG